MMFSNKKELFVAGAGSHVYTYILPNLKNVSRHTIVDLNFDLACFVGKTYNFENIDTSCERAFSLLKKCHTPVVVIATYHSTHVELAQLALKISPHAKVFVEKPPATTFEQLKRLIDLKNSGAFIEIGYNRRFAPLLWEVKSLLSHRESPVRITCLVKEPDIPKSHWYYWPSQGTRVCGNLCHWVDIGTFLTQSSWKSLIAIGNNSKNSKKDDMTIVINYSDESQLTIVATNSGNQLRGVQEHIDIRFDDTTAILNDFMSLTVFQGKMKKNVIKIIRDKGHQRMYRKFSDNIATNNKPDYSTMDLWESTTCYLAIVESINKKDLFYDREQLPAVVEMLPNSRPEKCSSSFT